jgi:hypothetical protein
MFDLMKDRMNVRLSLGPTMSTFGQPCRVMEVPCVLEGPLAITLIPGDEDEDDAFITVTHVGSGCRALAVTFRPCVSHLRQAIQARDEMMALGVDWSEDPDHLGARLLADVDLKSRFDAITLRIRAKHDAEMATAEDWL